MLPIPSLAVPAFAIMTSSTVVNTVIEGGNIAKSRVGPVHAFRSLTSTFEGTSTASNISGRNPTLETVPIGSDVAAAPVIDCSSIGILIQTMAPHLTEFLPPSSAPQLPSVVLPTATAEVSPLPSIRLDDFMEDFLQCFTNGFHKLFGRYVSLILAGQDSYAMGHSTLLNYVENIEKIGGPDRASFYWVQLQALDQHMESLNNVRQANISTIVNIEVT